MPRPKMPPGRFDRSVSDAFLGCFEKNGFASSLLEYAAAKYPIDLQFRKEPRTGRQWATLYVGMTAVLNIEDKKSRGYLLFAHAKYQQPKHAWRETEWAKPHSASYWADHWWDVEEYLERIIPVAARGSFTSKEGQVQAAVSVYRHDPARMPLDRETAVAYPDDATRKATIKTFSDELAAACKSSGLPRPPEKFGPYCDVLAIHADGHLEAIEVKPENVASLAFVPAQATMYSKLLNHWIKVDPEWKSIIQRMFGQRRRLGLIPADFKMPELQPEVRPAVAFQRTAKGDYVKRMFQLQDHLVGSGVGDDSLVFYRASLSGRLDPVLGPN